MTSVPAVKNLHLASGEPTLESNQSLTLFNLGSQSWGSKSSARALHWIFKGGQGLHRIAKANCLFAVPLHINFRNPIPLSRIMRLVFRAVLAIVAALTVTVIQLAAFAIQLRIAALDMNTS